MSMTDVAIVGAGPYGLSMAATLAASGVDYRVFGTPMQFWADTMPPGMALKTSWITAGFIDPRKPYSLVDYCVEHGIPHEETVNPIDLETFVAYGREFQRRSVPNLNTAHIARIETKGDGFRLTTDDGAVVDARRVVVATGIIDHRVMPDELASLSSEYVTHSATCAPFERFAGKDVLVIGAGASSVDTAAALRLVGGRPIVIARSGEIRYQSPGAPRTWWDRIRAPDSKLGPGWRALAVTTMPRLFYMLPEKFRVEVVRRFLGPAASWPARKIVEGHVTFKLGADIKAARIADGKVHVDTAKRDGTRETLVVDHVIAATGYRVDMRHYALLDPAIRAKLALTDDSPALSPKFESSVPGLYFVGTSAANSFGPMFRFVMGSGYTVRTITAHILANLRNRKEVAAPAVLAGDLSSKQA